RVEHAIGTASVAEAAAILASGGGPLLVAKAARDGVTVAAARKVPSSLTNSDDETECE
ncbi:cobalamin biosynthesis protein, partial [Rhodococcus erythropolis]|nr:cobalamin biosynthesis protein [Rhodococcus erythropolis]